MKVLIFGSGGREHALAWAIAKSERVTGVGLRAGQRRHSSSGAPCAGLAFRSDAMVQVAVAERADLTVVGPELPLSLGLVDELQARGLRVFGPTKEAAMLESSKAFAKRFLQRHQIPTANYAVCSSQGEAEKAIELFHAPIVVKADGLAAGKGVIICQSSRPRWRQRTGSSPASCLGLNPSSGSSNS